MGKTRPSVGPFLQRLPVQEGEEALLGGLVLRLSRPDDTQEAVGGVLQDAGRVVGVEEGGGVAEAGIGLLGGEGGAAAEHPGERREESARSFSI